MITKPTHSRAVRIRTDNGFKIQIGFHYVIEGIHIAVIPKEQHGVFGFNITEMRTGRKMMNHIAAPDAIDFDKENAHIIMDSIVEGIISPWLHKMGIKNVKAQADKYLEVDNNA